MFVTPRKEDPLSLELQKVIAERNILTVRSKNKVINELNKIHIAETQRESLRVKAMQEILSSELSYVKQLETVMKYFMEPLSSNGLITDQHFEIVFGNINTIYNVAGALVGELNKCSYDSVAPAFIKMAPFLKMYSLYACGYNKAISTLQDLRTGRHGIQLDTFLKLQESRPEVSCSLQSLLITPVQRLPRYRLLLQEVLSHTTDDHVSYRALKEALKGVEFSTGHVNSLLCVQDRQKRLVELQQSLTHGWPQVLCPGRCFLTEGNFLKATKCGNKAENIKLILLTDMFLCCRVKSGNMLECKYAFPLSRCSIETVLGKGVFKVSFGTETLLLLAKSQDEGEAWIMAMQKAIDEVKSSQMTLRKPSIKKKLPKRIEDLEETESIDNKGFLSKALRKRKQSASPGSHNKRLRSQVTSPLSPPRDSLYPLRASMKQQDISRYHLRRLRRPSRIFNDSINESDSNDLEPPKPSTSTDIRENQQNWKTQCVGVVRQVINNITSVFSIRFPYQIW